jgi:5-hydroxyisourate hydrolase
MKHARRAAVSALILATAISTLPLAAAAQTAEAEAADAGYVTTHVLDSGRGRPAAGMEIELYRIEGDARTLVRTVTTNADGRTDAPVIPKGELEPGVFELVFHAGTYLDAAGSPGESPRFLDQIPIRFGIADAGEHYHVPLLLAPYSYSTYRGS